MNPVDQNIIILNISYWKKMHLINLEPGVFVRNIFCANYKKYGMFFWNNDAFYCFFNGVQPSLFGREV